MSEKNPAIFLQAGSHPAEDVRRYIDAMVSGRGGIVSSGDLEVTEKSGTPDMSVDVAAGRIFIPGDEGSFQGIYFCENRATVNLTIATADATNPRKDLVVAKVEDSSYSGGTDAWSLAVVTGTPAASPSEPTAPSNSVVLALVDVPALDTSIENAQITDRRISSTGGQASGLGGIVITTSTNRPSSPHEGMVIYETNTDRVLIYDGSNWIDVLQITDGFTLASPTLTQGVTLTLTVNYSRYFKVGKLFIWSFKLSINSAGTASNAFELTLPVTLHNANASRGSFRYFDSGSTNYAGTIVANTTNTVRFVRDADGNAFGVATPTAASGDNIEGVVIAEEA